MTLLPSPVYSGGDPSLADLFPTLLPEPEKLIYEHVKDATRTRIMFPEDAAFALTLPATFDQAPLLNFYPDGNTVWDDAADDESPVIPVTRGTSLAYEGHTPAISVGLGNDSEDSARALEGGGFVGEARAYEADGVTVFGIADYYSQPLYASVLVQLIHENRDERDRLHNELRRLLFPLRRKLLGMDPLIRRVRVDSEKQDAPMDEAPYVLYVSLFTVHVYYEMLEATNVTGTDGIISTVAVAQTPLGITDFTQAQLDANDIEVTH